MTRVYNDQEVVRLTVLVDVTANLSIEGGLWTPFRPKSNYLKFVSQTTFE